MRVTWSVSWVRVCVCVFVRALVYGVCIYVAECVCVLILCVLCVHTCVFLAKSGLVNVCTDCVLTCLFPNMWFANLCFSSSKFRPAYEAFSYYSLQGAVTARCLPFISDMSLCV